MFAFRHQPVDGVIIGPPKNQISLLIYVSSKPLIRSTLSTTRPFLESILGLPNPSTMDNYQKLQHPPSYSQTLNFSLTYDRERNKLITPHSKKATTQKKYSWCLLSMNLFHNIHPATQHKNSTLIDACTYYLTSKSRVEYHLHVIEIFNHEYTTNYMTISQIKTQTLITKNYP